MIVQNLSIIIFGLILCAYHGSTYITWIEARIPLKGNQALPGTPWPVPQQWNQHENVFIADPQAFHFESNVQGCDILEKAYDRYREIMFHGHNYTLDESLKKDRNIFNRCTVHVTQNPVDCDYPKYGALENYEIMIRPEGCRISSDSVWGALYGLETLSQLLYPSYSNNYLLVNQTYIHDWPEYKYRGLLLDTARHFIPLEILLANLDAMAYNKFNVFHWHLVDDQSFPYASKRFPELTRRGAYSSKHVYTQKDVKLVIDYARMRGIRVLPEIDSPGHTKVFERAFPNILTPCYGEGPDKPYTPRYPEHSDADNLHPLRNETYSVMLELFKELKEVFPDEYIHLGMDEVYYACWKSNPEILSFMQANGWTQMNQVEQYYVRRTLENVKNINYKYMIWQDPVDNGVRLANDSLVEVWKDTRLDPTMKSWQEYTRPIAQQGYEIVLSACWYLNYINYPYPGRDWELYYLCDPRSFTNVKAEKDLVVGGEACLWSEFADGTNILSRIWPRASAVAERLWTNPNVNDVDSARFRLDQHRCRMLERGIPAAPLLNGFCGDYEWANKKVSVKPGERISIGQ